MAPTAQFHCFKNLPYDIRHQIYLLATPPRIVRVHEVFVVGDEWYDLDDEPWVGKEEFAFGEFQSQLLEGPLKFNLRLHPDLVHFAHNWRRLLPWPARQYRKQTKLEEYGFTSNRGSYEPWRPTSETPEIPIDWLTSFPELAFDLARDSYICSASAIPTFLHVCTESREALMSWGYQLTFATRSHGPKVWFHFGRDRLYIPKTNSDYHPTRNDGHWPGAAPLDIYPGEILSGCCWDIGQFLAQDLGRVKHLILGASAITIHNLSDKIRNILPLFSDLEELFLEEWDANELMEWFIDEDVSHDEEISREELRESLEKEAYDCIAAEDIDPVADICWMNPWDTRQLRSLYPPYKFGYWQWKKRSNAGSYFEHMARGIEKNLASKPRGTSRNLDYNWKIPRVRHIHVCPESVSLWFMNGRLAFWKYYECLRHRFLQKDEVTSFTIDVPNPYPPFSFNWGRIDEAGRGWVENDGPTNVVSEGPIYEGLLNSRSFRWYFEGMAISEPSMSLL